MWLRPPARPVKPLHKHNKVVLPSSRFLIYFVIAGLWAFLWVLFAVFVHFPCVIVQITLVSVACVLSATAVISLVCIPAVFFFPGFLSFVLVCGLWTDLWTCFVLFAYSSTTEWYPSGGKIWILDNIWVFFLHDSFFWRFSVHTYKHILLWTDKKVSGHNSTYNSSILPLCGMAGQWAMSYCCQ